MNNINWVNTLKGIGILTVVCGHIYEGGISNLIYLFHMPLFFFISGFLFKPSIDCKNYLIKKTVHLIIPYFSFLFILDIQTILGFTYNLMSGTLSDEKLVFFKSHFSNLIIGGEGLKGDFGVFWFVTCLFFTQQVFNILINTLNTKKITLLMFLLLIAGYLVSYLYPSFWLPLSINVMLGSVPIFYLGFLSKSKSVSIKTQHLILVVVSIFIFTSFFPLNTYDMKAAEYGIPFVTLISSLTIILLLVRVSKVISNYNLINTVFYRLADASIVIMFLHQSIQTSINSSITNNPTFRFLLATIISYFIFIVISKFKLTRVVFLGSLEDFYQIFRSKNKSR